MVCYILYSCVLGVLWFTIYYTVVFRSFMVYYILYCCVLGVLWFTIYYTVVF